jgi:hypothetical protein
LAHFLGTRAVLLRREDEFLFAAFGGPAGHWSASRTFSADSVPERLRKSAKSRATLTPHLKSPSALISLRKIAIGKSSFASNRDPTQEVDSHK